MTKHIILDFVFEEVPDKYDPEYIELVIAKIKVKRSDLTEGERMGLGETVAQTDEWQVGHWIDIQDALTMATGEKVVIK